MTRTYRDFITECELWEYSKEHYELMKECAELDLMKKYIENVEFTQTITEYYGDSEKLFSEGYLMESANLEPIYEAVKKKSNNIFSKVLGMVKKLIDRIIGFLKKITHKESQFEKNKKKFVDWCFSPDGLLLVGPLILAGGVKVARTIANEAPNVGKEIKRTIKEIPGAVQETGKKLNNLYQTVRPLTSKRFKTELKQSQSPSKVEVKAFIGIDDTGKYCDIKIPFSEGHDKIPSSLSFACETLSRINALLTDLANDNDANIWYKIKPLMDNAEHDMSKGITYETTRDPKKRQTYIDQLEKSKSNIDTTMTNLANDLTHRKLFVHDELKASYITKVSTWVNTYVSAVISAEGRVDYIQDRIKLLYQQNG